jgi:hypothetical protein
MSSEALSAGLTARGTAGTADSRWCPAEAAPLLRTKGGSCVRTHAVWHAAPCAVTGGRNNVGPVQLRVCAGGAEGRQSPPQLASALLLGDSDGVVAEGTRILAAAKFGEASSRTPWRCSQPAPAHESIKLNQGGMMRGAIACTP